MLYYLGIACHSQWMPSGSWKESPQSLWRMPFPHLSKSGSSQPWRGNERTMTRLKKDEWARKGRSLNVFLSFPRLPLRDDLLIVQTCLQCKIWNKCVGSWVGEMGERLKFLRRLWTDGLPDWTCDSHLILNFLSWGRRMQVWGSILPAQFLHLDNFFFLDFYTEMSLMAHDCTF